MSDKPKPLHIPVLLDEVLESFASYEGSPSQMLDGTFGRGGHTRALMERYPQIKVQAVDKDVEALEYAKANFASEIGAGRLSLFHGSYGALVKTPDFSAKQFDFILLDLGVSSPQLDQAGRGFSFYNDGPLDMRMNTSQKTTAATIINEWDEEDLVDIFKNYGEIHSPFRVIRAILNDRVTTPFTTTHQLAGLIERVEGWKKKGYHPATQYFMGLRLRLNEELEHLEESLPLLIQSLVPGGIISVITFHSLEDRIVKTLFKNSEWGQPVNKKVIVPGEDEETRNPRSRSAKLRVFKKDSQKKGNL